jgi:Holliday junction resolvase RusA-like endonuclease
LKNRLNPRHITRPDADKLVRAVADALTGVLWRDDSQIDRMMVGKFYVRSDEAPGVEIRVTQVGP